MTPTRKQLIEFSLEMGRRTRATVRQCEALLRYAGTLRLIPAAGCNCDDGQPFHNVDCPWHKRERIQRKVMELCGEIRAGDTFSLRFYLEDIKTNLTGRDYPQERWTRSLQYANEALTEDYCEAALGELCVPVFSGAVLKIRMPDGGEVVVPS